MVPLPYVMSTFDAPSFNAVILVLRLCVYLWSSDSLAWSLRPCVYLYYILADCRAFHPLLPYACISKGCFRRARGVVNELGVKTSIGTAAVLARLRCLSSRRRGVSLFACTWCRALCRFTMCSCMGISSTILVGRRVVVGEDEKMAGCAVAGFEVL